MLSLVDAPIKLLLYFLCTLLLRIWHFPLHFFYFLALYATSASSHHVFLQLVVSLRHPHIYILPPSPLVHSVPILPAPLFPPILLHRISYSLLHPTHQSAPSLLTRLIAHSLSQLSSSLPLSFSLSFSPSLPLPPYLFSDPLVSFSPPHLRYPCSREKIDWLI